MKETDLAISMAQFAARMQARQPRPRNEKGQLLRRYSNNRDLHDQAIRREPVGRRGEAELWVVPLPCREEFIEAQKILRAAGFEESVMSCINPDALCGYVSFSKRQAPRFPRNCQTVLEFIPVHGGITYARKDSFSAVWGFDTNHSKSHLVDRTYPDWVASQCHILHLGLQIAEEIAPLYVKERSQEKRAELLQKLFDIYPHGGNPIDSLGFGAMIHLLTGEV